MTITQAMEQFAIQQTADNRSPNTIECYQRELKKLAHFFGPDTLIKELNNHRLNQFLNSDICKLRPDGKQRTLSSIANTKAIINAFFKWLANAGLKNEITAITTRIPKIKTKTPTYLTCNEVKALLKTIKETRGWRAARDYTACMIILKTGLRISELIELNIDDVDLKNKKLHIKKSKGGQPESKHINGKLMKNLKTFIDDRKKLEPNLKPLFISQWRKRLNKQQFANRLKQWTQKAGINKKVTPHTLRHTFATALYAKTKDIIAVQKALGHAFISTTEIYTHIDDQDLKKALETL